MFNRRRRAERFPVFLDGADTVRANRNNLLDVVPRERCQILLSQLLKEQIVTEPANRIARTFILAQNAKARAKILHHPRKIAHNLAALRIVTAHASQPQAILLRPVEDGQLLSLNKFIALAWAYPQRIAAAFQGKEEFRAVIVLPCAGIYRASPQTNDDRQVLDTHRALKLASAACCAFKRRLL